MQQLGRLPSRSHARPQTTASAGTWSCSSRSTVVSRVTSLRGAPSNTDDHPASYGTAEPTYTTTDTWEHPLDDVNSATWKQQQQRWQSNVNGNGNGNGASVTGEVASSSHAHVSQQQQQLRLLKQQQEDDVSPEDEVVLFERALAYARARRAQGLTASNGSGGGAGLFDGGSSRGSSGGGSAGQPAAAGTAGMSAPAAAGGSANAGTEEFMRLLQRAESLVRRHAATAGLAGDQQGSAQAAPAASLAAALTPAASGTGGDASAAAASAPETAAAAAAASAQAAPLPMQEGPVTYESSIFTLRLMDDVSPSSLSGLPLDRYRFVGPDDTPLPPPSPTPNAPSSSAAPHEANPAVPSSPSSSSASTSSSSPVAILLRGHQLLLGEVPLSVCCIARCGPGAFTNVPIPQMTELGIPVFNTPGANSNAVKEAVVCALIMAARGVIEARAEAKRIEVEEQAFLPSRSLHLQYDCERMEQRFDEVRRTFRGTELEGKTLGVIGLGAVGSRVVGAALALGMHVVGFDPWISPEATWKLPGDRMARAERLEDLMMDADFISVHVPYFNRATHHLINAENLQLCKRGVHLVNFSPAQIVDGAALRAMFDSGRLTGRYIADFADPYLQGHPQHLVLPHLGACTREAETKAAGMAAASVKEYLELGNVRHSVNFPAVALRRKPLHDGPRLCIVVNNEPGVLGAIATFLGSRSVNIEQEVTASRGFLAYIMLDMGPVPDPAQLQVDLARECPGIISSRFIGRVGGGRAPTTLYNINVSCWPTLDSFDFVELREHAASFSSVPWSVDGGSGGGGGASKVEEEEEEDGGEARAQGGGGSATELQRARLEGSAAATATTAAAAL